MSDMSGMRGNPNLSKMIFQKAKQITESHGENSVINKPSTPKIHYDGGAFASIEKRKSVNLKNSSNPKPSGTFAPVRESLVPLNNYFDSIQESLELLENTKEYSNALRGLLTLYLAGNLNESVMSKITKEDKRELLGILRDFEYHIKDL
jgi:hypothetical protein